MNSKDNVLVVLSTYNGEKHLKAQLDSILCQTIPVTLLIRDDGSTDNTMNILTEYSKKHNNIILLKGENVGVIQSFSILLSNQIVDDFRWVAFCDQDDYWKSNKLYEAVTSLSQRDYNKPLLYCSNLDIVDCELNHIRYMRNYHPTPNEYKACIQNIATGCTQLFNQKAIEIYREGINNVTEMHDYWMYLICVYFGEVIYDNSSYILYRQHNSNVIGAKNKNIKTYLNHIQSYSASIRCKMLAGFYDSYSKLLSDKQKRILKRFLNAEKKWTSRLAVFFSMKYIGYDIKTTLGFKSRVLLGKIY